MRMLLHKINKVLTIRLELTVLCKYTQTPKSGEYTFVQGGGIVRIITLSRKAGWGAENCLGAAVFVDHWSVRLGARREELKAIVFKDSLIDYHEIQNQTRLVRNRP